MDKKTRYLLKIKNRMLFRFTREEIVHTIGDLKQMFESGKENGKTEEELCLELGEPGAFVNALMKEESFQHVPGFVKMLSILLGIGFIFGISSLFSSFETFLSYGPFFTVFSYCLPVICIPLFAWHLSGGRCLYEFTPKLPITKKINLLIGIVTFLIVMMEQTVLFLLADTEAVSSKMMFLALTVSNIAEIGKYTAVFLEVMISLKIFFGEYALFPALVMNTGFFFTSVFFGAVLARYEGSSAFSFLVLCALPYMTGLIYTGIWKWKLQRKGMGAE